MKIKKLLVFATLLALVATMVLAVGCKDKNSVDNYLDKIYASVDKTTQVVANVKMHDSGVLVQDYTRTIKIVGSDANVTITETKLATDYIGYETTTTEQTVQNFYRQTLLPIDFNESNLVSATIQEGKLTVSVDAIIATAMLGNTISPSGNVTILCQLEEGGNFLQSIVVNFQNTQGRDVELSWTYSY